MKTFFSFLFLAFVFFASPVSTNAQPYFVELERIPFESHQEAYLSYRTTVETGPFEPVVGEGQLFLITQPFDVTDPFRETVFQGTNAAVAVFPTIFSLIAEETTASVSEASITANGNVGGTGLTTCRCTNSNMYWATLTRQQKKLSDPVVRIKAKLSIDSGGLQSETSQSNCSLRFEVIEGNPNSEIFEFDAYHLDEEGYIVIGYYLENGFIVPVMEFLNHGQTFEQDVTYKPIVHPNSRNINLRTYSESRSDIQHNNEPHTSTNGNTRGVTSCRFSLQLVPKLPIAFPFDD